MMEDISALLNELCSADQVVAYKAERKLNAMTASMGSEDKAEERQKLASAIVSAVNELEEKDDKRGNPTVESIDRNTGRQKAIRYLSLIGDDNQVEFLKGKIHDQDVREMVRWSLDRIPGEASTKVLIEAATNGVGDEFVVGAINSLGRRSGEEVVQALKKCAGRRAASIRLAAAEALANQPDPAVDETIVKAAKGTGRRGQLQVAKARLRLAEQLLAHGHEAAGKKILDQIKQGKGNEAQKKAADLLLEQEASA